jgi:hypothetical protein
LRVGLVNERNSSGGNYTLDEEGMHIGTIDAVIPFYHGINPFVHSRIETSGISLNSTSRAELMQKLAARQSDTSTQAPVYKPAPAP